MRRSPLTLVIAALAVAPVVLSAAQSRTGQTSAPAFVLRPARVFDGEAMQAGWVVVVGGARARAAGAPGPPARPRPAARLQRTGGEGPVPKGPESPGRGARRKPSGGAAGAGIHAIRDLGT